MKMIKVIRHGTRKTTPNDNLLVGDIILLETGDAIPADILYAHGHDLKADFSSMTGENELILIDEHNPFLLAGCRVMEGSCTGIVVAVGIHSQWGKIKLNLDEEVESTPLQNKLTALADLIGKAGMAAAILLFVVCVLIYTIGKYAIDKDEWDSSSVTDILDYLIVSISLICVAVPEGLPLAVTISLAYSMFEMMKDNNLVRHLSACETMGGATNICSDKTGTLTENKMKVISVWMGGKDYSTKENVAISGQLLHSLATGISINSSAYLTHEDGKEVVIGSTTEGAMIKFLRAVGVDYQEVRNKVPVKKVYPFSSLSKRMATVIETGSSTVFLVKGAAEVLVESCESYQDENGEAKPIDRKIADAKIKEFASQGLRTLCIAYAVFPKDIELPVEIPDTQLTLTAVLGIKDPVRQAVPNAVLACRGAGVTVRMVTGDNAYTARHIAKECHILTEDGVVLEGPAFRKMTDDQLDEVLPRLQVLARSSPNDKLRLVQRLKALGEVVASTGDGTNDAPQLKAADVGFSMGITGTEVAKEASDIILLDDNFASIVKAVMWGRNVYDSIRKFLQFQLTVNLAAMIVAFVGAVSNGDSPLKSVQLLWVNLIMDTFAALALATEKPTPELLDRKPYGRFDSLITKTMWKNIVIHCIYQVFVLLGLLYAGHKFSWFDLPENRDDFTDYDDTVLSTIIFNSFVFCQLFNEINCRKLYDELNVFEGIFKNWIFHGIMIFTIGVQILIVEFGGDATKTTSLDLYQWLSCIAIGAVELPLGFIAHLIRIERHPTHQDLDEGTPLVASTH